MNGVPPGNSRTGEPAPDGLHASFEHDLDEQLNYAKKALLLTGARLIHTDPGGAAGAADGSWDLTPDITATAAAYNGVGEIELRDPRRLLGRWHYTIGRHAEACAFVQALNAGAAQTARRHFRGRIRTGAASADARIFA